MDPHHPDSAGQHYHAQRLKRNRKYKILRLQLTEIRLIIFALAVGDVRVGQQPASPNVGIKYLNYLKLTEGGLEPKFCPFVEEKLMKILRLFLALAFAVVAQEALNNDAIVKMVKSGLARTLFSAW